MVGEIFLSESGRTYTSLGDAPKRGRNRAIIAKSEGENFFLRTIRKGSREAVILSKLDHPGILSNLDIA